MTRRQLINTVLIALGILIILFFGIRALHAFRQFNGHHAPPMDHVETDVELIRDWMTVPFISRMYHVPEDILFQSLGISPEENRDKSLKLLNQEYFPDQDGYVIVVVKSTILAHQPAATPLPDPSAIPPAATLTH